MNDEKEELYSNKYFRVIEREGMFGIEPTMLNVVVMPFEKDGTNLPKSLGVLKEYNPMRDKNYSVTLVTGSTDDEDPDILSTAKRELKEESGYDVEDPNRWYFLGFLTTSKMVRQDHPCFAVDVTGLEVGERTTDGTENEEKSEFVMMPVKQALATNDCYIPSMFMKIFRFIFGFGNEAEDPRPADELAQEVKHRADVKYLNVPGVIESQMKKQEDGAPYIEYIVKEVTPEITAAIPSEVEGIKVVVSQVQEVQPSTDVQDAEPSTKEKEKEKNQ